MAALILAASGVNAGTSWAGQDPVKQCREEAEPVKSAAEVRRARLAEVLRHGFGIQYWGDRYGAADLAAADHGLLVIEAAKVGAPFTENGRELYFGRDDVVCMQQGGNRVVIGYLNVAEIEPYRDYWADEVRLSMTGTSSAAVPFAWYGPESRSGERLARYWSAEWEEIALRRVDRMMALGYDGILLDDVLHYYTMAAGALRGEQPLAGTDAPEDAAGFARAMMHLVVRIADRARAQDSNALILVNNGAYIGRDAGAEHADATGPATFDTYRSAIDGILMESLFAPNANPEAIEVIRADFRSAGIGVMTVDFVSYFPDMTADAVREEIAWRAAENGFSAYVADNPLFDRLYAPIIDPELAALRK